METTDVHPPLHHAILWVTVRIFGTSEFAVRLPSLIAGVALVPAMYWVGKVVFNRRTGWIAAVLATIAPFCVWYSQEARMYSQFMLFAALAIGAQVLAVRRGRWYDWALYAVSTALLFWTQYFGIMPIVVQQLGFGWAIWQARHRRHEWRRIAKGWALTLVAIGVMVAPVIPILQTQYAAYANRGIGLIPSQAGAGSSTIGGTISIYSVGANLIWAFFGYHADGAMVQIAALWPLLMLLGVRDARPRPQRPEPAAARARRRPDGGAVRDRFPPQRSVRAALLLRLGAGDAAAGGAGPHGDDGAQGGGRRHGRRAHRGDGRRARRPAAERRQPPPLRLQGRVRPHRGGRQGGRHRAVRTGLPRRGRPLLRART